MESKSNAKGKNNTDDISQDGRDLQDGCFGKYQKRLMFLFIVLWGLLVLWLAGEIK